MAAQAQEVRGPLPLYVETWLSTFESKDTRIAYRVEAHRLMRFLDVEPLFASVDQVMAAATKRDKERPSNVAWNRTMAAWRSLFTHMEARRLIMENPSRFIKGRQKPDIIQPTPTVKEIKAIWGFLGSAQVWNESSRASRRILLRNRCMMALLVGCGLRNAEIRRLRAGAFMVTDRLLIYRRKGRGLVNQPWPMSADAYILPHIAGMDDRQLVFSTRQGRMISSSTINGILKGICREAKVKPYTCHAFRRFAGTAMIARKGELATQGFLGHASLATTQGYNANRHNKQAGELYDDPDGE